MAGVTAYVRVPRDPEIECEVLLARVTLRARPEADFVTLGAAISAAGGEPDLEAWELWLKEQSSRLNLVTTAMISAFADARRQFLRSRQVDSGTSKQMDDEDAEQKPGNRKRKPRE